MISFFLLPKGVLKKLNYYRSRFFWQGDSEKKKYRLVKWRVVCRPKDQGGLGVHDLQVKNTALLCKWLFKLLTEDGRGATLFTLTKKGLRFHKVSHYHKQGESGTTRKRLTFIKFKLHGTTTSLSKTE
jgi:hypothetical protein